MVLAEVDDSGDGVLTFEEVIDWMQEKDLWDMEKAGEIYTPPDFSDDMHVLDRKELGATLSRYAHLILYYTHTAYPSYYLVDVYLHSAAAMLSVGRPTPLQMQMQMQMRRHWV